MYYVMDEFTVQAGKLQLFTGRYAERYVPNAEARGLKLVGSWVNPPVEPEGESIQVVVIWSLDGSPAFWSQSREARQDPTVAEWWREAEGYLLSRERKFMAAAPFSPLK